MGVIHMDDQLKTLQSWINESSYTVAVTGAGVSVTAGIPDMQHTNIVSTLQMMSETILKAAPGRYYKGVYKGFLKAVYENGPTETHRKLAQLESVGKLQGIITTNIDCLHSIAGSENVAEIQGSFAKNTCLSCGKQYDDPYLWSHGNCPKCPECGGSLSVYPVRHRVELYQPDVIRAREWISRAELVLVIGTNGPYGGVYYDYIRPSARIVQINPRSTAFDSATSLNIREQSDIVFKAIQ